jgi:hypothetical protein
MNDLVPQISLAIGTVFISVTMFIQIAYQRRLPYHNIESFNTFPLEKQVEFIHKDIRTMTELLGSEFRFLNVLGMSIPVAGYLFKEGFISSFLAAIVIIHGVAACVIWRHRRKLRNELAVREVMLS